MILETSFTGKKPPDEIMVIDKLNESNVLKSINLRHKNKNNVNPVYKKNILNDCLKVSE